MWGVQQKWGAGLLCICLASFLIAGCRTAQQFARPAANAKPSQQGAAQPAAGVKQAEAEPGIGKNAQQQQKTQQLATEAKDAAANTEQAANDLLSGLKKDFGGDPYPSSGEIVNVNYSSEEKILTLPGINPELAMKIIRNRPYATPTDLVAKHVLTEEEYDRIKSRLTAWDNLWTNPD